MRYMVVFEKSETGYGAYVPDLPGLGVVGDTLDEVRTLIREGIDIHISSLREHGDPVPPPACTVEEFEVAVPA